MEKAALDAKLKQPGIHLMVGHGWFGLMEVELDGKCHQLDLATMERCVELEADGWVPDALIAVHGPFVPMPSAPTH
jgi:hypothetical protein